ncbi:GDSL-type esterase/lipase family protein [Nocardia niigatensis]
MLVACRRRAIGFDFDGVAALASEITGRTIKRVTVSDEDFRQQMVSYGVPLWQADMMVDIFTAARAGEFATVEPTLAELIGREPIGFDTVLREALADTTGDPAGAGLPLRTTSMPFLSGLDVRAPEAVSTIVALGDSITDGYVASNVLGIPQDPVVVDRAQRYPDFLQHRLDQAGLPFSVVDAGISGNRLTRDGLIPQFGPAAPTRLQPDILDQPGVTDVIILEGINDLGIPVGASYDQLASGYTNLIDRLHAAGLRVHLGTILPAANALNDGILTFPTSDPVRRQLNSWIRGQQLADSVIDFDAALRDPADPSVLAPRYAGADNLHPNAAGHRAMADAIDLTSFGGRS